MYKKTVTFTSKVSNFTDGTVSAQIQAENDIVNQLAQWLQLQMPSMQQLEKVSIGDDMWANYPMYAVQPSSTLITNSTKTYNMLTDVFVFGDNADNFCCGLCADKHILRFAPICSIAKQKEVNAITARDRSIQFCQLRDISRNSNRVMASGAVELASFSTSGEPSDDTLSLTIEYWKGACTLVLSTPHTIDCMFFTSASSTSVSGFGYINTSDTISSGGDVNAADFSCALYSFSERCPVSTTQPVSPTTSSITKCLAQNYASNLDIYYWFGDSTGYYVYEVNNVASSLGGPPVAVSLHRTPIRTCAENMWRTRTKNQPIISQMAGFPRIDIDQICMRKVLVPVLNVDSGLKLVYTPGTFYGKNIYLVNGKTYLAFSSGWTTGFIEVADQG